MTREERKHLAEQLKANPLWDILMAEIETDAIERMISASTDLDRMEAQAFVRAARAFRANCEAALRNTQPRKGAPC